MPMKVRQLIEILQDLPQKAEIFVIDVDEQQEFSISGIDPGIGLTRETVVNFGIQKKEDEG